MLGVSFEICLTSPFGILGFMRMRIGRGPATAAIRLRSAAAGKKCWHSEPLHGKIGLKLRKRS